MKYGKWFICKALVAALFFSYAPTVGAAPVRWTFTDTWFDDGTPVMGSFVYEAEEIPAWMIDTFGDDDTWQPFRYRTSSGSAWGGYGEAGLKIEFLENTNTYQRGLSVILAPYQDPPADPWILFAEPGIQRYWFICEWTGIWHSVQRHATSGILVGTPIPVPSTMLLLGTGLIGLGWRKYRRRKQ